MQRPEGGLAGAGLAHEAEGLPLSDAQGDAVDGPYVAHGALEESPPDGEPLAEMLDLDEEAVGPELARTQEGRR